MSAATQQRTPPKAAVSMAPGTPAETALAPVNWEQPTNKNGLERLAPLVLGQLQRGLPRFLMGQGDRLIRCMITECQKNPALMDCAPISLFGGVIQAGQLGLTIGGPLGEAYFIPFNNRKKNVKEAQLIIGYKGFIALAHRSDKVARITPVVVRDGDHFKLTRGSDQRIEHVPQRNSTGRVTDYYVTVELVNGGRDFESFTYEEAMAFRDRYSTTRNAPEFVRNNSPWYDMAGGGFDAMALKTLIRRLAKRLPLSVEISTAAGLDEMADRDESQHLETQVMPALAPREPEQVEATPADTLRERLDTAKAGQPTDGKLFTGGADNLPD